MSHAQVVINEIMVKPSGGNTSQQFQSVFNSNASYGHEWIEIYNTDPCTPVDISCWSIGGMDGSSNGGAFSFPTGTTIPPLGFIVIGGPNAANVDFVLNLPAYNNTSGWLWTSGATRWHLPNGDGWLSLYDASGTSVDAVYWTFSANDPNKITNDNTYDGTPQRASNCGAFTFASAETIYNGGGMEYISSASSTGQTFARDQDGSMSWIVDTPTPKACNGICVQANAFTISSTMITELCLGDNDGSISIDNITGGSGTFTYAWTPGGTGNAMSNLTPGTYDLTITDTGTGCQFDTTFILPPGPVCTNCTITLTAATSETANTQCNTGALCIYNGPSLLINEVHVKPNPSATAQNVQSLKKCTEATYGSEFIEIYNPNPCAALDISCYIISTSAWSSSTNGSFRFPVGTSIPPLGFVSIGGPNSGATFDMFAYCGDPHQQTGNDRWYLDNGDAYVALYDDTGTPLNAVFWTTGAGEANKWGTDTDLDEAPAFIPAGITCSTVAALAGPATFPNALVDYAGATPAVGNSLSRSVDGGATWAVQSPTVNNCNGACVPPFSGGSGSCDGTASATPTNGLAPYTYLWNDPNGQTTQTATGLCAGAYCVTVTDANNCVETFCVTVTDNTPASFSTLNETICSGSSYLLNGTSYSTAGSYNDTIVGGAANGCDSIVTLNLTVSPIYNLAESITVCENDVVTYPDGTVETISASTTHTSTLVTQLGCDSIIVTAVTMDVGFDLVENIELCLGSNYVYPDGTISNNMQVDESHVSNLLTSTGCDSIITTNITIVTAIVTSNDVTICIGEDYTYPDGTQSINIQVNESLTIQYVSSTGCDSLHTTNVLVSPLPAIEAGADITTCTGQSVTLSGSGGVSYQWDNNVVDGQSFTPPNGTTVYTVTGVDALGCENTDLVTVTVTDGPVVTFSGDHLSGCAPHAVTFTNLTPGSSNCVWDFGNGQSAMTCGPHTVVYNNPGFYDVSLTVTDASGCTGTAVYQDYIEVLNDPVAQFVPSTYILDEFNSEVIFNNTSVGATSYQWDFGDGSSGSNVENPIHLFPIGDVGYVVTLYAFNDAGCFDSIQQAIQYEEQLIYYVPNTFTPDGDEFNNTFMPVFTSGFDPFDYNLLVFNRWGEVIFESNNALIGWDGTHNGNLVQDGTYVWKIEFKETMSDERHIDVGHVNMLR